MLDHDDAEKVIQAWVKASALRNVLADPQDVAAALNTVHELSQEIYTLLDAVVPALVEDSDESLQ